MIIGTLIIFVLVVWFINKLLFGELYGDDEPSYNNIQEARRQQRQQYQQYQQFQQYQQYQNFQQREQQRFSRHDDEPVIIEQDNAPTVKHGKRAISEFGEYVDFREVEE